MGILKDLQQAVEKGYPGEAEKLALVALDSGMDPLRIVEDAMMPAMRNVGERYKNEETDILRILAAARSIRVCFDLIERRGLPLARDGAGGPRLALQ